MQINWPAKYLHILYSGMDNNGNAFPGALPRVTPFQSPPPPPLAGYSAYYIFILIFQKLTMDESKLKEGQVHFTNSDVED